MGNAEREREQFPRCWTIQSQAERRDRGQTEESWLLFEGIDTFLYDLMRKSKIENRAKFPYPTNLSMAGYWSSDWFSSIFGFSERQLKEGSLVLEGSQLRSTVRDVTRASKCTALYVMSLLNFFAGEPAILRGGPF